MSDITHHTHHTHPPHIIRLHTVSPTTPAHHTHPSTTPPGSGTQPHSSPKPHHASPPHPNNIHTRTRTTPQTHIPSTNITARPQHKFTPPATHVLLHNQQTTSNTITTHHLGVHTPYYSHHAHKPATLRTMHNKYNTDRMVHTHNRTTS